MPPDNIPTVHVRYTTLQGGRLRKHLTCSGTVGASRTLTAGDAASRLYWIIILWSAVFTGTFPLCMMLLIHRTRLGIFAGSPVASAGVIPADGTS